VEKETVMIMLSQRAFSLPDRQAGIR